MKEQPTRLVLSLPMGFAMPDGKPFTMIIEGQTVQWHVGEGPMHHMVFDQPIQHVKFD